MSNRLESLKTRPAKRRFLKGVHKATGLFGLWRSEGKHEPWLLCKGNPPNSYLPAQTSLHGRLHTKDSKVFINETQIATIRSDGLRLKFGEEQGFLAAVLQVQIEEVLVQEGLMKDV